MIEEKNERKNIKKINGNSIVSNFCSVNVNGLLSIYTYDGKAERVQASDIKNSQKLKQPEEKKKQNAKTKKRKLKEKIIHKRIQSKENQLK